MGNLFTRPRRNTNNEPVFTPVTGVPVATVVGNTTNTANTDANNTNGAHLELNVSSDKQAVAYGSPQKITAMLSIKAPPAPDNVERPPIDLVACIDKSGSMGSMNKMTLMKTTLKLLVERSGLKGGDRVSLVTFDSNVTVALPLTEMDGPGRARASEVVQNVRPGSTTNLSGGALQAIDVLDASAAADAPAAKEAGGEKQGRTRAVMLFTDGLANDGIRETPRLVSAVNGALAAASAKLGGPISLFTFGFGADHNEDCLRSLATGSGAGGLYYYVASAEEIPNAFADCLGGLTSVVAQNATLALAPAAGVSVSRVLGSTYQRDADGKLKLGDLFADDEKDVLVELTLPKLGAPDASPLPALSATLRAFNIARSAPDTIVATLLVFRPEVTPEGQSNAALDAQRNRIEAAEAMEAAARLADAGDLEGGRATLQNAKRKIAGSASATHAMSLNLVAECDTVEAGFADRAMYRAMGSKMSKMSAMSHGRQRATHMNQAAYKSAASNKKKLMASWQSSVPTVGPVGVMESYDSDSD